MKDAIFSLKKVSKVFPGVKALDCVDLYLYPGQVTALIGENGAGKSTLVKTMTGIYQPDGGEIIFNGQPVQFHSPHDSHALGITAIHQETVLFDDLTVAENIFLGNYPMKKRGLTRYLSIDWSTMVTRSQEILSSIKADMDPNQVLRELSIGQKHMVGIARALSIDAKVVILDEPTAALSHHEIQELYELVNTLKQQGKAILFITHKFDEIFALADRYTVFRDGCYVAEGLIEDTNEASLVEMMVARSIEATYPKKDVEIGETLLEVSHMCHATEFDNISFSLKKGEILGVYGLVGSGRTEVMQALFGTTQHVTGMVKMNGKEVIIHSPKEAIDNGIVYVPEERQKQGVVLELPIYQNISLPQMEALVKQGQIDQEGEMRLARQYCERLQVKASSWDEKVMNLSGGNQQKVVIAKWLATNPKVIILDEPTKGIDIGSKAAVHEFMSELVEAGLSVIMVSSELPEILGMSDRILVMNEGLMVGELSRMNATPEKVVSLATGGSLAC
ncbi:sugar ABC transporter ATP-binding protein [Marinomonas posidonica]|uniref:Monosaccharide-transporting ATPase n=1 Tax=Marinomonas posidonica (strain CECT 7376 / NCIMB 14433 / IVIA-Po-181) TaxID=491952 RepID=F6CZ73_MARPP|nr:sugar ABC transporter ATP-binding protein [Marinomonas posidonica]AEF53529.1 Monosaccharide-transporting ATPase [Marinomonas posidonica IVIA-Po-181]